MTGTLIQPKRLGADKGVEISITPGWPGVAPEQWERLCPGHPDAAELLQLISDSGMDDFSFHSLVVRWQGAPRIVLPLTVTRYPILTTLDGDAKTIGERVERFLPGILSPRGVFVGFIEGEWGQIGIDQNADSSVMAQCWIAAQKALNKFAKKQKALAVVYWQFVQHTVSQLPPALLANGACASGQPFGELPLPYKDVDEYLSTLDSDMRRYLKRTVRNAKGKICVERTAKPGPYVDTIYQLYQNQCNTSELKFGEQRREYFASVCDQVPGAEYVLYFLGEQLLAFELVFKQHNRLVSKYFGMNAESGREHKLYFYSWMENVRHCIENGIPYLYAGASGEELKSKLGAQFKASAVIVKARNPLINLVLRKMQDELSYDCAVPVKPVSVI